MLIFFPKAQELMAGSMNAATVRKQINVSK